MSPIVKKPSIPMQVADQLIGLIKSGKVKPGEKLPSEEKMTKLLGISRITLREAKKMLEAKGYIESRGKGRKYVSLPVYGERSSIEDLLSIDPDKIWELLEVRRILDSEAASMASGSSTAKDRKTLRSLHTRAVERKLGENSPMAEENAKLYAKFFDAILEATHNTIFAYLRRSVNKFLLGAFPYGLIKLSTVSGSSKDIIDQLGAIVDAIESRDPLASKAAMAAHIDYLENTLRKAI